MRACLACVPHACAHAHVNILTRTHSPTPADATVRAITQCTVPAFNNQNYATTGTGVCVPGAKLNVNAKCTVSCANAYAAAAGTAASATYTCGKDAKFTIAPSNVPKCNAGM